MIITNSFSISMMDRILNKIRFIPLSVDEVLAELDGKTVESAVGHMDTANVISSILGIEISVNRINVKIPAEGIIVAQYSGPRLPEGSTTLPDGAKIEFWWVGY